MVECGRRFRLAEAEEDDGDPSLGVSGGEGDRLVESDLERKESRRLSEFMLTKNVLYRKAAKGTSVEQKPIGRADEKRPQEPYVCC